MPGAHEAGSVNEVIVYTAREAAEVARCSRARVDGACSTGALAAHDLTPNSSRRSWRILAEDLREWIRADYPLTKHEDAER